MKRLASALPLVAAQILAGCSDSTGGSAWAGTVTDSAGIAVVGNPPHGTWDGGEAWTVQEELSIGGLEADAEYQFGQIAGIDVDGVGNLYVVDQQAREVRVFGPDGGWLRTIGAAGSGPGELGMGLNGVFVVDGEVLVPDLQNQRVNRYEPSGEPAGDFRVALERGVPVRWDGPIGGRLAAQLRVLNTSDTAAAPAGDPVVLYAPDGSVGDTLLVLPPGQSLTFHGGAPRFRFFDPEPMWDAGPDGRVVSGLNDAFRLEVRTPAGTLERVVTLPRERSPVTERDRRVFLDAIREMMETQGVPPQAIQMMMQNASFADDYPVFASVLAGPAGSVWAQRFRTGEELADDEAATFDVQDMGSPDWDVFDAGGRYLGVVSFPPRVQPIRAEGDLVYAVARDELDVQRLAVYRIVR